MREATTIRRYLTCHKKVLFLMLTNVLVCSRVDDVYADLSQVCRNRACVLSHKCFTAMLNSFWLSSLVVIRIETKSLHDLAKSGQSGASSHLCVDIILEMQLRIGLLRQEPMQ